MGDFIDAALGFPAVVFSVLLVVVVVYWVLVLAGAVDVGDSDADGGLDGILDRLDLGGTPATVVLSVVVAIGWFASLVGTVALDAAGVSTGARVALAILVLLLALVIGGLVARLASRSLRRLFPTAPEASRSDFVGRECVIRTGRVDPTFGQAEVHAAGRLVRDRPGAPDRRPTTFAAGTVALIFDYDADGEFFWVVPPSPHPDPTDQQKDR